MSYHHLAHLQSFEAGLREGIVVKRGDVLGRVGKTGTSSPHLHYEVRNKRPPAWTSYVRGMTKAEVQNLYPDPAKWIDRERGIPSKFDRYTGYMYLDPIGGGSFHPGVDINSGKSGVADEGEIVLSPCNGTIVYAGTNAPKSTTGWGNHMWIKESESEDLMQKYDDHIIQETEESGSFALVYGGEKHIVSAERAGFAALTVIARKMIFSTVSKSQWETIPTGKDF